MKALPLISLAPLSLLASCTWSDARGTHHLVLGLGVVTTREHIAPAAGARAAQTTEAGLLLNLRDQPALLIGFRQSHEVEIDPASDAAVDAAFTPDLSVTIRPSPGACRRDHGGLFTPRGTTPCRESSFFR